MCGKMKKIGLLTFHTGMNYGGFFQMFSTYSFLKSLGYEVEVINYVHPKHYLNERRYFYLSNLSQAIKSFKRYKRFREGLKKIKLSPFRLKLRQKDLQKYDILIVGSDIVWNYQWKFLGSIKSYALANLNPEKAVAFVPSCGFIDLNIDPPNYFIEGLKKFHSISVRDSLTQGIVKKYIQTTPSILLDPTFLINYNDLTEPYDLSGKYILVYSFIEDSIQREEIMQFSQKNNLKIIGVGYHIKWADMNISSINPFQWLDLFMKADLIYTSTFHGTLYSIHFRKNFITLNNEKIQEKIKNVIKLSNLEKRVVRENDSINHLFREAIDYKVVQNSLEPEIRKTKNFLIKAAK